jgi:hypothetical protein
MKIYFHRGHEWSLSRSSVAGLKLAGIAEIAERMGQPKAGIMVSEAASVAYALSLPFFYFSFSHHSSLIDFLPSAPN